MEPTTDQTNQDSQPQQDTQNSIPPAVGYTESESNKLIIIMVIVLMIILLSLVGIFFYKQYTATSPIQPTPTPGLAVEETRTELSPTVAPPQGDEAELEQIVLPDIDKELQELETEVNQL